MPVTSGETAAARRGVLGGLKDIDSGRYQDFDAQSLLRLPEEIVADSIRKIRRRKTACICHNSRAANSPAGKSIEFM